MIKDFSLRKALFILLIIIVGVLLYFKVVPFGNISYEKAWPDYIKSGKGFIYSFSPAERIDLDNKYPKVIGDPVYFSLFTPRTFNNAKITVTYKNKLSDKTPIVEAGVLVDNIVWRYHLEPLENKVMNHLEANWNRLEGGDLKLWQRNKDYSDFFVFIEDLYSNDLDNCSDVSDCVALYNYSLPLSYYIDDVYPIVIDQPLRGMHQFYVYVADDGLELDLDFVDLNQDKGEDSIKVVVYRDDEIVGERIMSDDNLRPTSGEIEERSIIFHEDLDRGVYKVEVKISDDMVIKRIESSSHKLSFINKVWPVSTVGKLNLYTDSQELKVKALNPASRQTIVWEEYDLDITEIYKQFVFRPLSMSDVSSISLEKDDIILESSGVFAWSKYSLFNPSIAKIDESFEFNKDIHYVLTNYDFPEEKDGWTVSSAEFNLKEAYREKGKYSFMISIPGLKAEDDVKDYLEVKEIRIELEGRTLFQKLKSLF